MRSAPPARGASRARVQRRIGRASTYATLVVLTIAFVMPFLLLLSTALKPAHQNVFSNPPELLPLPPVLDSFFSAWTTVPFGRYLLNSLLYELGVIPIYLVITVLTAYPLAVMRFRGRGLMFNVFVATMFLPAEVMLIPRFLIVTQLGLGNTLWALIFPAILSGMGVYLLRQAFRGVPLELREAASLDGCGPLRTIWHVMVPTTLPTLAVLAILGFVSVWNSFIWPLVVLNDNSSYPVVLGLAFLTGVAGNDYRTLAAGTVISVIPMVVFFLVLQKRILSTMGGAVKQ